MYISSIFFCQLTQLEYTEILLRHTYETMLQLFPYFALISFNLPVLLFFSAFISVFPLFF